FSVEVMCLPFLIAFVKKFSDETVSFFVIDYFLYLMSKYFNEFCRYYHFLLAVPSVVDVVLDKRLTFDLLVRHHVPRPKVIVIHEEKRLADIIQEITFPCILKPLYSANFRKRIGPRLYKKVNHVERASRLRETSRF